MLRQQQQLAPPRAAPHASPLPLSMAQVCRRGGVCSAWSTHTQAIPMAPVCLLTWIMEVEPCSQQEPQYCTANNWGA